LLARAIRDQIAVDLLGASQASLHGANRLVVLQMPEDPAQRSRVMRAVPSKHTSIEKLLRTYVSDAGIRGYRLHAHNVPGTPDMVFTRGRLAIFVDGCFWHGCQKCYREPRSNKEYWKLKVKRNRDRDQRVNAACAEGGWRVLRLWEHEVKASPRIATGKILRALKATTATSSRSQRRTPAKGRAMARAA
jgi:DNA mismatch endonuclease (patch repair protein)